MPISPKELTKFMNKKCHVVGIGFDSHAFGRSGTLVLGGRKFKKIPALKGHSDGDALTHAVIDALLGAAGLGDIGDFFPDTSKKFKGISSLTLLKEACKKVRKKGYKPLHVDVSVIGKKPRLSAYKNKMRSTMSKAVGISKASFNIKAKTPEGLKFYRAPGGVAVYAIATLTTKYKLRRS